MILVGVDPGKATGIAVWCDGCCREHPNKPDVAEVEDSTTAGAVLRRMLGDHSRLPNLIALERFVQGSRKTRQPDALQVTGQIGALAAELGIKVVYQQPGSAKKIAPNALLRRIGWYVASRDQHGNDALRHVLLVLATFFPETFAKLIDL